MVLSKQKNLIRTYIHQQEVSISKPVTSPRAKNVRKHVAADEVLLDADDFIASLDRLIDKYGSIESVYTSVSVILHARAGETTEEIQFKNNLGSDNKLQQFFATLKHPRHVKDFWIHMLGREHFYDLVNAAISCNFDAISELAQVLGGDVFSTVNYINVIERTINAATACLQTTACNFHYVGDFIMQLLTRPWAECELEDLVNGRYHEIVNPGDVPNINPLLSVSTKMAEDQFKEFYYALIQGNYKFFAVLGNLEYEMMKKLPSEM